MIGYSSHSAGCALTQSIPSAPAVCNHRSSYRQTHLKRYVGFTFSCRLPIDNIRFGQPETPMYLRPFLSHRTVPFRSTRSSRSSLHSVVADLGGKAENLLTDESFRSCKGRLKSIFLFLVQKAPQLIKQGRSAQCQLPVLGQYSTQADRSDSVPHSGNALHFPM